MGMTYTVDGCFHFKNDDPSEFCRIIADGIRYLIANDFARFNPLGDLTDPFECFRALCPNAIKEGNFWTADFDASYGWEGVLISIFEEALAVLEDGSHVDIYPDDYWEKLYDENGKVQFACSDDDSCDDEEEDFCSVGERKEP